MNIVVVILIGYAFARLCSLIPYEKNYKDKDKD